MFLFKNKYPRTNLVSKCSEMYIRKRSTRVDFVELASFTHTIFMWFFGANKFCLRLYSRNCLKIFTIETVYTEEINRSWQDKTSIVQPKMTPFLYVILLHIPASNLMHKNDKKRLEIAKSILFYIHKHCTTSFTSLQHIFTSRQPIFTVFVSKVANSKREKRLQNDIKRVDLSHRVFKGPPML